MMPDESEQDEAKKPEVQQKREITPLPGEDIHSLLKRISQTPRKEGESGFVTIRGIGPISVIPADFPSETESTDVQSDEENEEHFRNYWERKRRFAKGITPDSKAHEK
jgi:hypothetical protein